MVRGREGGRGDGGGCSEKKRTEDLEMCVKRSRIVTYADYIPNLILLLMTM